MSVKPTKCKEMQLKKYLLHVLTNNNKKKTFLVECKLCLRGLCITVRIELTS